ncbi:MAG TPA: hypothetical protein VJJ82_05070 [Candidatus Nanoarchaeia archaeon]|nr:hypothetical protein [Candidatus Nanoarchaeia archaeon]
MKTKKRLKTVHFLKERMVGEKDKTESKEPPSNWINAHLDLCTDSKAHEWESLSDTFALMKVDKTGDKVTFYSSIGLPVIVRSCKKCGLLRLFYGGSRLS